jgi:hypothetical protein
MGITSKFAQHLLENGHSVGSMENIMDVIHTTSKRRTMATLEKFYIYRETKCNNQINDRLTVKPNVIFETVVHKDPHRVHTTSLKPYHPQAVQS